MARSASRRGPGDGRPGKGGERRPDHRAIALPERPASLRDRAVAVWAEPVLIDTYPLPPPDRNPLFLERRVYQGSSGRVYPNPVTDRVSDVSVPMRWQAIHLENEHLRVMVLPDIGGRIHVVEDRHTGYDLVYRQNVIKPALVGLLGPWISGGIELNWPQHHRPSTFMPTAWATEELPDGGAVAWCSEHDPMLRMKGMHGVTLRPGSSLLELQVRLVDRTPFVQTFLWWANVAVRVHDRYEAFFPPDVHTVADHARRAMSTFPVATGRYYGVDYGARPAAEADLRWYRNIPVPTSYMAIGSRQDFFGGYDHAAGEGFVHWADHTISPGKKLWTWGDHEFGHAWDRELTDADGPYVELMAGVFTDNQPDFSFLLPGEVRTFSQYWYPIVGTGPVQAANLDAAVSLTAHQGSLRVAVAATRQLTGAQIRLVAGQSMLLDRRVDLAPERPFVIELLSLPPAVAITDLRLSLHHQGRELLAHRPEPSAASGLPLPASEPPPPAELTSAEELYLTGLHLEQYRHATRDPEPYLREALRRDAGGSRANTALGAWYLRRGELDEAVRHLRVALERLTRWNANPSDGEASYLLGVALRLAGDLEAADEAFGKAAWDGAFMVAATTARAELALARGDSATAETLLARVLAVAPTASLALVLRAAILRRRGDAAAARATVERLLEADPLDLRALHEQTLLPGEQGGSEEATQAALPGGTQAALDVAHDEARAGLLDEALDLLARAAQAGAERGSGPMLEYTIAWLEWRRGDEGAVRRHLARARAAHPDWTMPDRLEEIAILEWASQRDRRDPRAPYYLGNLLYDRRRYQDAIRAWRRAARLDPDFPTVHRNLGLAEHNVLGRPGRALAAYRRAFGADPSDARVLYELDQLRLRLAHEPSARLRSLEAHLELVEQRDDLTVAYVTLLNRVGRLRHALALLQRRRFHPWEGGEGLVSRQWVVANRELAREALRAGRIDAAVAHARATMAYPLNLGEGKHLLTPENEVQLLLGRCLAASGDQASAREWYRRAAEVQGDPDAPAGDGPYWQALALRELSADDAADARLTQLRAAAQEQGRSEVRIPYFATSLPSLLLFDDDLTRRAREEARYLEALALLGQGRRQGARARLVSLLAVRPDHLDAALRLAELDAAASLRARHTAGSQSQSLRRDRCRPASPRVRAHQKAGAPGATRGSRA
jgi:tetratricopeptide (TPR) repeat protein